MSFFVELARTSRAGDCVEQSGLTNQISRLSPRAVPIDAARDNSVHVVVQFDRTDDEYRARLNFFGAKPGERLLSDRGPNCRSLGDAVAVAIAMLLDSEMARDESMPIEAPSLVSDLRISSASVYPRERRGAGIPIQVAVQGGTSWGFVRGATPTYELGVGRVTQSRLMLELGAMGWFTQSVRYDVGEVSVGLLALTLRGCRVWGQSWQVAPCAALALGRLHGIGHGFDESNSTNLVYAATGASVLFAREVSGPLQVALHGMAWIPLTEQSLAIKDLGTAWKPAPIWLGIALRVAVRFY